MKSPDTLAMQKEVSFQEQEKYSRSGNLWTDRCCAAIYYLLLSAHYVLFSNSSVDANLDAACTTKAQARCAFYDECHVATSLSSRTITSVVVLLPQGSNGTGSCLVLSTLAGVSEASQRRVWGSTYLLRTRVYVGSLEVSETLVSTVRQSVKNRRIHVGQACNLRFIRGQERRREGRGTGRGRGVMELKLGYRLVH